MWEFNRTVEAGAGRVQKLATKECTSPSDDMKKQHDMGAKAGCTVSPVTKSGNSYTFVSNCTLQGQAVQSKSVLSVESDSAYKINVDSQAGGHTTKELLVAKRTGDC